MGKIIKKYKEGNILVTWWENPAKDKDGKPIWLPNITIQRSYFDKKKDCFVDTYRHYRKEDLPGLIKALEDCLSEI